MKEDGEDILKDHSDIENIIILHETARWDITYCHGYDHTNS